MTIKDKPPMEPQARDRCHHVTDNNDEFMIRKDRSGVFKPKGHRTTLVLAPPIYQSLIMALVSIKRACAQSNRIIERFDRQLYEAIELSRDAILGGQYTDQFLLSISQAVLCTQTNMNVNEVSVRLPIRYSIKKRMRI